MKKILKTSLVLSSLGAVPLMGQTTYTWDGNTDATWATATNWDLDSGAPVSGDTAKFADAGNGNVIIDLAGSAAVGTIDFSNATAAAYTIGITGVDTLNLDIGGTIFLNGNLTNSQIVAADVVIGDGSANTATIDNNSATETLTITGNIEGGTGGAAGLQKLSITNGTVIFDGDFNEGGAERLDILVNTGSDVTFNGNDTSVLASSRNRLIVTNGGTATISAGASVGSGAFQFRNGTVNLNSDAQKFNEGLYLGNATTGDGDATLNIGAANQIHVESTIYYQADDDTANTGVISGGAIYSVDDRVISVEDNALVAGPELTINSRIGDEDSITGSGDAWLILRKTGAGTLRLTNSNNTYDWLMIDSGVVQITDIGALGTNKLRLSAGAGTTAMLEHLGGDANFTKEIRLQNDGTNVIENNGTGNLTLSSANLIENGTYEANGVASTLTLGGSSGVNTVSGVIRDNSNTTTGAVNIAKTGVNTWVLDGDNTNTGTTTVEAGRLDFNGANSGTGAITVADGAQLGGDGTVVGDITFSAAGSGLVVNGSTAAGLTTSGHLDVSNGVTVYMDPGGPGDIDVITYGTINGSDANFVLDSSVVTSARGASGFMTSGNTIQINLGFEDKTWVGNVDGNWDATTGNWSGGTDALFLDLDSATFDDTGAAAPAVTVVTAVTATDVTFNQTAGGENYTLSGEALTVGNQLEVVGEKAVTINNVVAGDGKVVLSSPGALATYLTLAGDNTYTGGTEIRRGWLTATHDNALGTGDVRIFADGGVSGLALVSGLNIANDIYFDNLGSRKDITFWGTNSEAEISGNIHIEETTDWATEVWVGSGSTLIVSGLVSSANANGNLRGAASGTIRLTNDANTFGGPIRVDGNGTIEATSIANAGVASAAGMGNRLALHWHDCSGCGHALN